MSLLQRIPIDELTPGRLWSELDPETRRAAAVSLYRGDWPDDSTRREADAAIAAKLRFRELVVRRLPVDKRVGYLVGMRADDSLATSLLLALHLDRRKGLLGSFLDRLEVPHHGGVIDDAYEMRSPEPERLADAVDQLYADHRADEVDAYLASLVALEPATWNGLVAILRDRR